MKRILLRPGELRPAAVALARFAVDGTCGRKPPDAVHEHVTEGRRSQWERAHAAGLPWAQRTPYSSCGDLAHWLLWCLGCRDERLVNRGSDGGTLPWQVGANISRLVSHPAYVGAPTRAGDGSAPGLGDILHVVGPDHVSVLLATGERWRTADYGQPYGVERECPVAWRTSGLWVRGRMLAGWLDLEGVVLVESAIVPDGFEGEADGNPYAEGVSWPVG